MNTIHFKRAFALATLLALAAFAQFSCDENPSDDTSGYRIAAYSGNNQTERVGATLADPIVVRATDLLNNPKSGIAIEFRTAGESSGEITPRFATTDASGLASCAWQLGTKVGTQYVTAAAAEDSTVLSATALDVICSEENPQRLCIWPANHIFIATTGSRLLTGTGTVIIDYDPSTKEAAKVLETAILLDGISFSSRGELFVSAPGYIGKVVHDPLMLVSYSSDDAVSHISLDPNEGSVLAGLSIDGPVTFGCKREGFEKILAPHTFSNIVWPSLAVDQVNRDLYLISGAGPPDYVLWRLFWDGRTVVQSFDVVANLSVGAAAPAGMCIDSTGTVYIAFDGNDNYRRIVRVSADGAVDYEFFNFYTHYGSNSQEAGRWGDIAYLAGKLYVIDKRNDRLVVISKNGELLDEINDTAFSPALVEGEHYAICASPTWLCQTN